jgi:hypothetical protein
MNTGIDRPSGTQAAAEALLRDPALTISDIAKRLGVSRQRVNAWNRRARLRPPRVQRRAVVAWPPERRAALARLVATAGVDPGDVTEALGFARASAPALLGSLGLSRTAPAMRVDEGFGDGAAPHPRRLRARLRAHIGRQIGLFDAALAEPGPALDSAKVLRDLGGLKKLLDDLDHGAAGDDGEGEGGPHDASSRPGSGPALDVDAVRAEIARRYDRLIGGGASA